ncbi:unnamed protein product [Penicillium roqueforti FM164]|uniref:Genomic scaffold, ProqFM164S03 n=1 Tax=Penicillium roqueforti (strain FM164) TaxID=1365484 RepID=W6QA82_PENRF|nr:unnamed protein product [Penicillium roqueforti FM164]
MPVAFLPLSELIIIDQSITASNPILAIQPSACWKISIYTSTRSKYKRTMRKFLVPSQPIVNQIKISLVHLRLYSSRNNDIE